MVSAVVQYKVGVDNYKLRPPTAGIDHVLAQHVAHLFIRNTVSLFEEKAKITDVETDTDHFEVSHAVTS